jgi:hypothetical protein
MSLKIVAIIGGRRIKEPTECFAVPGADHMIDLIDSATGLSHIGQLTLEEIRFEDGGEVQRMTIKQFCDDKARRQDAEPRTWTQITEDKYHDMLGVLPPAAWNMDAGAFLVGEAMDHHAGTGKPRFSCYKQSDGKFWSLSTPITHAQFCELFGRTTYYYSE